MHAFSQVGAYRPIRPEVSAPGITLTTAVSVEAWDSTDDASRPVGAWRRRYVTRRGYVNLTAWGRRARRLARQKWTTHRWPPVGCQSPATLARHGNPHALFDAIRPRFAVSTHGSRDASRMERGQQTLHSGGNDCDDGDDDDVDNDGDGDTRGNTTET